MSASRLPANAPGIANSASRHAREGRACQACHMPERRHLWRGIHDPEMVKRALGREVTASRLREIDVTIKKLTKGNPTMAAKFAELKQAQISDGE